MEPVVHTMADVFTAVTGAITQVISWMGTWLDAILDNPVLLFFCIALPLLTIGITIIRRLLRVRA